MFEKIKNKNSILLVALVIVALFLVLVLLISMLSNKDRDEVRQNDVGPEFMSLEEKKSFGLPEESRIQVLIREADGTTAVYKVIRSDEEIIHDINSINSIDPRYY